MPQTADIEGIGLVEFPDDASLEEITQAGNELLLQKEAGAAGLTGREAPNAKVGWSWEHLKAAPDAVSKAATHALFGRSDTPQEPDWETQSMLGISPENIPPAPKSYDQPATNPGEFLERLIRPSVTPIAKAGAGVAGYMTSPQGVSEAALAATPAAPLVVGKWLLDMLEGARQEYPAAYQAYKQGDYDTAAEHLANAGAMTAGVAKISGDAVKALRKTPKTPPASPLETAIPQPPKPTPPPAPKPAPAEAKAPVIDPTEDFARELQQAMTERQIRREPKAPEPKETAKPLAEEPQPKPPASSGEQPPAAPAPTRKELQAQRFTELSERIEMAETERELSALDDEIRMAHEAGEITDASQSVLANKSMRQDRELRPEPQARPEPERVAGELSEQNKAHARAMAQEIAAQIRRETSEAQRPGEAETPPPSGQGQVENVRPGATVSEVLEGERGKREKTPQIEPEAELQAQLEKELGQEEAQATAQPPAKNTALSERLRRLADQMDSAIEAKRNPAIAQQNVTARRSRIAESMGKDADRLERIQQGLRAIAEAHEAGDLPPELLKVSNRAQVEEILRERYPQPYFNGTALDQMLRELAGKPGITELRRKLGGVVRYRQNNRLHGQEEIQAAKELLKMAEKYGKSGRGYNYDISSADRLNAAGIPDEATWQKAHDWLKSNITGPSAEVKAARERRQLESSLIGSKIPGFFPTPKPIIEDMLKRAEVKPGMNVLEPSAGKGDIVESAKERGAHVEAVETNPTLVEVMRKKGLSVEHEDFLGIRPEANFDRILMNPPFESGQDMAHVRHAYKFLKPGGKLVAIMGEGAFFRNDAKAKEFRKWLADVGGTSEKLAQGAFTGKEAFRQTGTASRIVEITKEGWIERVELQREQRMRLTPERAMPEPGQSVQSQGQPEIISPPNKPPVKGSRARATKVFDRETDMNGPDVLSWMVENMKLLSKSAAKENWTKEKYRLNQSLWDDAPPLSRPHHNVIYSKTGYAPDRVAQAAYDAGIIPEPYVNDLWEAIRRSSRARSKTYDRQRQEQREIERQVAELESKQGQPDWSIEERPEEPLFGKPESVEEQKARLAREAEQKKKSEQRRLIEERAKKPLTGTRGDIGQGDLLGGGDLFSLREGESFIDALDRNARHFYGKDYEQLSPAQQEQIATAVEGGPVPRRQPTAEPTRRQLATYRKRQATAPAQAEPGALPSAPAPSAPFELGAGLVDEIARMDERMAQLRKRAYGLDAPNQGLTQEGKMWLGEYRWLQGQRDAMQSIYDAWKLRLAGQRPELSTWAHETVGELTQSKPQPKAATPTKYPEAQSSEQMKLLDKPSIGSGIRAAMEKGRQSEAGAITLPTKEQLREVLGELPEQAKRVFDYAKNQRQRMSDRIARSKPHDAIKSTKDAADNRANIVAKEAFNIVLHELNRAFGVRARDVPKARNALRENALTFAIEAGGHRFNLGEMRYKLEQSQLNDLWKRRALQAIDFAQENWDKLQPAIKLYQRLTEAEQLYEVSAGVRSFHRKGGYVFHLTDVNETFGRSTGTMSATGGAPAPFKKMRDFDTYAEKIAAGQSPVTLNALELLQRRYALGQRLVNYGDWVDSFAKIEDPVTKQPLIVEPEWVSRKGTVPGEKPPAGMPETAKEEMGYFKVPGDYELIHFGGRDVGLHKGYTGLMADLTDISWFRKATGRQAFMQGMGLAKHTALMFDTFHMGRLAFWNAMTRAGAPTYKRGLTLLDNSGSEIRQMIERGEIPREWGENLARDKVQLDRYLRAGLNVGSVGDNLYTDILQKVPGLGHFNRWLFEKYQRGAMAEVALLEGERLAKQRPELSHEARDREVAKQVNTRFGNLQSQSWIRSKTGQDLARVIFLAPQWNESLIRAEIGALKQVGKAALKRRPQEFGMLARGVGTALLAQFVANQLLNYATRGHPTWENPEEDHAAKISAWIPDVVGGSHGFFLNPLSLPIEIAHLIFKNAERHHGDVGEAVNDFARGRFSSLSRGIYTFLTGKRVFGPEVEPGFMNRVKASVEQAAPLPISGSAVYRMGKQVLTGEHEEAFPGQFERQTLQSMGIKTEAAPSPERRIRELALRFNRSKNVREEPGYHEGMFTKLTQSVRLSNMRDATKALNDLLEMDKSNGIRMSEADVMKHYQRWQRAPFTHANYRERDFYQTLTPEQQAVYNKAVSDRQAVTEKVMELIEQRQTKAAPTP